MKQKWVTITALSLLMQLSMPKSIASSAAGTDLERLHWLCMDYQLPIKGYVVECWFELPAQTWTEKFLEQHFGNCGGKQQVTYSDGSIYNSSVIRGKEKYSVELQLITQQFATAKTHYKTWQPLLQQCGVQEPVGATIVAVLPEVLKADTMQQFGGELLQSLAVEWFEQTPLDWGHQIVGYSPQLEENLEIAGQNTNINVTFQQQEDDTVLYLGTPIIYQQY